VAPLGFLVIILWFIFAFLFAPISQSFLNFLVKLEVLENTLVLPVYVDVGIAFLLPLFFALFIVWQINQKSHELEANIVKEIIAEETQRTREGRSSIFDEKIEKMSPLSVGDKFLAGILLCIVIFCIIFSLSFLK